MSEHWIDDLPDFPVFLEELTAFAQSASGGMQRWAMSQWSYRSDPRGHALDLVEFAEQSEEGRELLGAWRTIAQHHAGPAQPTLEERFAAGLARAQNDPTEAARIEALIAEADRKA